MDIKGFVDLSLVDWDGRVSSVIFLPRCNLRCPYCYNSTLVLHPVELPTVPFKEIEDYLKQHRNWIEGVVITGGEPTVHEDLLNLCSKIKGMGFLVKLDTNGTNPNVVKRLIEKGMVDYVALDVKAPLKEEKYSVASGVDAKILLEKIRETIKILLDFKADYEFRTTLVPTLHEKTDVEEICREIRGCKKYVFQNFRSDVETINPAFKGLKPFTDREMEAFLMLARKYVPDTILSILKR
jgi:pyruvate formate lyase activating enzyme